MSVKVAVVGSINVDLVTQVARFPQPGETIIGGDLETIAGGKGANQAVAASRLGADVTMVGRVGDDVFASQLKMNLVAEGIDVTHVSESSDTASGVALILVDNAGQNIIVVASGANVKVTPIDVDKAAEAIASADVLLLQLEIPLESVHRAAQIAQEQGVKVVLNPAPAQPLAADLLSLIDFLIPNESETSTLINALTGTIIDAPTGTAIDTPTGTAIDTPTGTAIDTPTGTAIDELSGLPATSPEEMRTSMAKLRTIGVNTVILTAGEQGAFLAEAGGNRHFAAFSLEQVVDTTAAGDAFVGGLATAIAEGKPLSEAILWGNAAGMLAVTRAGAQPSLPSRVEVEALLVKATAEQRQGVRM